MQSDPTCATCAAHPCECPPVIIPAEPGREFTIPHPVPLHDAEREALYTIGPFFAGDRTNPKAPKIGTRIAATLGGALVRGVVIGHGNRISRAWGNVTVLLDGDWAPTAWPITKLEASR